MRRNWIKLYVDQCLRGSMMSELNAAQCWQWVGFLLLGGDSIVPGIIFRRKDDNGGLVGYSDITLAETLNIDIDTYRDGIRRMIEKEKISVDEKGVITILNWHKYQSEYQRQKPYLIDGYKKTSKKTYKKNCNKSNALDREGEGDREREEEGVVGLKTADPAPLTIKEIIEKWNRFADGHNLPAIRSVPKRSARERSLKARMGEQGFDFESILRAIHEQPFLFGDNDRGWLVTFDWILKPSNLTKVLERAYIKNRIGDAQRRAPEDPYIGRQGR